MSELIIKPTTQSDLKKYVNTEKASFDSDAVFCDRKITGPDGYDSVKWHENIMKFGKLFTAFCGDEIVGGAIVFPDENDKSKIFVGRIFISPDYFRKGFGTKLMSALELIYADRTVWNLDTPIWNERTNKFYRKIGYTEIHKDEDSVYYEKLLNI